MKKSLIVFAVLCFGKGLYAQEISQNQVPSVILNQFNYQFPRASDVEWEMKGNLYSVDFEIGWNNEHEIWYNRSGEMVKHEEELLKQNLSKSIKETLQNMYRDYSIDDIAKITEGKKVIYKIEIEKGHIEKTFFFNEKGKLINQ